MTTNPTISTTLRLSSEEKDDIEAWRSQQRPIPTMNSAMRTLIVRGLKREVTLTSEARE